MNFASTDRHNAFSGARALRWLAPALASVLLHVFAFEWMNNNLHAMPWQRSGERIVIAALEPAAAISTLKPVPTAARTQKTRAKPVIIRPAVRPAPQSNAITPDIAEVEPTVGTEAPGTSADATIALVSASSREKPVEPAPPAVKDDDKAHYHVDPPPSIELQYDVQKVVHEGNPIYGHGKIAWQVDGDRYVISGEAGVLFITALTFKSEGMIDEHGVAPIIYSEKRFRRSETNTHFQRERNTISFSASTQTYPRQGGEQDRASIVWQLAGIGRGDGAKFMSGAEFDLFVAGIRDGEVWRIQVIGEEDIVVDGAKTTTWHVMRMPRAGSYDQKLDIWLAPQLGWYPVKIRYTEINGDYLDMSVSNLKFADTH
jgi:hypothetical protein